MRFLVIIGVETFGFPIGGKEKKKATVGVGDGGRYIFGYFSFSLGVREKEKASMGVGDRGRYIFYSIFPCL